MIPSEAEVALIVLLIAGVSSSCTLSPRCQGRVSHGLVTARMTVLLSLALQGNEPWRYEYCFRKSLAQFTHKSGAAKTPERDAKHFGRYVGSEVEPVRGDRIADDGKYNITKVSCAVLRCVVLGCVVLRCAVSCWAALRCAVLCCAVPCCVRKFSISIGSACLCSE